MELHDTAARRLLNCVELFPKNQKWEQLFWLLGTTTCKDKENFSQSTFKYTTLTAFCGVIPQARATNGFTITSDAPYLTGSIPFKFRVSLGAVSS